MLAPVREGRGRKVSGSLLSGKTALITGAASGIGAAAAMVFAGHGARVMLADIDAEGGRETASTVEEHGGESFFVQADMRSEQDVAGMVQATVERFGRLDCAFNNAGIDGKIESLHECTRENWEQVIAVNLTGVWLCLKYEIRQMLDQGGGSIVNTSSAAGLVGLPHGLAAYVAAKHGVIGVTRAAALEYVTRGVRVNAICPGAVRTPMLDDLINKGLLSEEDACAIEPIGRLASPAEVAEAAAWLCSDAASYVTGHPMPVDGGMTAGLNHSGRNRQGCSDSAGPRAGEEHDIDG
jgi:NAD(P)-dependent dehydrogenase (short-subunit alcohol dehydrogenase family)